MTSHRGRPEDITEAYYRGLMHAVGYRQKDLRRPNKPPLSERYSDKRSNNDTFSGAVPNCGIEFRCLLNYNESAAGSIFYRQKTLSPFSKLCSRTTNICRGSINEQASQPESAVMN